MGLREGDWVLEEGEDWNGVGWGEIARADLLGEDHKAPFCPSSNTPFPPFH